MGKSRRLRGKALSFAGEEDYRSNFITSSLFRLVPGLVRNQNPVASVPHGCTGRFCRLWGLGGGAVSVQLAVFRVQVRLCV